ncbi:Cupredoxin [Dunaliella salina]|uniref:Cupredoxin n=1 Tax=Dunaliella salina TaxID=3046 RepID=A0ABQ7GGC6_DUNSA|nr:Cupredoxin [Dunaliella salina]|eukprot:KAF5833657.1 Cupredoxin [Dunaliella salina]
MRAWGDRWAHARVVFLVIREPESPLFEENSDVASAFSQSKNVINGYVYCNLPGLEAPVGSSIRWHAGSLGGFDAMHNFHWHGNTMLVDGRRVDQFNVLGGNTLSADMSADNPGVWLFHCHVNKHLRLGMQGVYKITGTRVEPEVSGVEREYFIAAEEVLWHYDDLSGLNQCGPEPVPLTEHPVASMFLGPADVELERMGSNITKAMYVEYTDGSFSTRVNRSEGEEYLGLVGPILKARVGDTLVVTFKNNLPASRPAVSLHPHGVLYDKTGEGAPYNDGTGAFPQNASRQDDNVAPGDTHVYVWNVTRAAAPGPGDVNSKLWMYHSHSDEAADTQAGLFGGIIVYPADPENSDPAPSDADRELVLFFAITQEVESLYLEENLKMHGFLEAKGLEEWKRSFHFFEASLRPNINGLMFCNMPAPEVTAGQRVRLHVMSLGDMTDIHTVNILGGVFESRLQGRTDAVAILAGSMLSFDVVFTQPGIFPVACAVALHGGSGMQGRIAVVGSNERSIPEGSETRTYYIKAEAVEWNYAPEGVREGCANIDSEEAKKWLETSSVTIGPRRMKALFRQYTNSSFSQLVARPRYHGMLGPLIAAEVGDVVEVTLQNDLEMPINFYMGGAFVRLEESDNPLLPVPPGGMRTYRWIVPEAAGPKADKGSSVSYAYASQVIWLPQQAAGLFGLVMVVREGMLGADGVTPTDVDHIVPVVMLVTNENNTPAPLLHASIERAGLLEGRNETAEEFVKRVQASEDAQLFQESNRMRSINGLMFCNFQIDVMPGKRLRLLTASFGAYFPGLFRNIHSPLVVGQVLKALGEPTQSETILPGISRVVDLEVQATGTWPLLCGIDEHQTRGMVGNVNVGVPAGIELDLTDETLGVTVTINGNLGDIEDIEAYHRSVASALAQGLADESIIQGPKGGPCTNCVKPVGSLAEGSVIASLEVGIPQGQSVEDIAEQVRNSQGARLFPGFNVASFDVSTSAAFMRQAGFLASVLLPLLAATVVQLAGS